METSSPAPERPRILLADDAEIGRSILKTLLRSDFDVIEARNGLEAIQALTTSPGSISAAILDVVMPVMDGFRVLKFMREKDLLGRIPAVMITAISDDDTKIRCFEAGATDVIEKPYNERLLLYRVRALVASASARDARSDEEDAALAYAEGLLDALPDAVYATDPATHSIRFCNAAFRELPGIPAEPVGRGIHQILPENVYRAVNAVWEDLVLQRRRSTRFFHFPGDPRVWCITYNALLDNAGEISDYIGHITDVTLFLQAAPQLESTLHVDQNAEVIL